MAKHLLSKISQNKYAAFGIFIFAAVFVLFLKNPQSFLNPQFWAEDGRVWFTESYNLGVLKTLLRPQDGYFQTFSRLIAGISSFLPLYLSPLLYNLSAYGVMVVTSLFIFSARSTLLLENKTARLLLAFGLLLLPNTAEVSGNLTNTQWYLALLACLVVIASPAKTVGWRLFDVLVLLLSGLSGPFVLFLLPIAAVKYYKIRSEGNQAMLSIVAGTAALQLLALFAFSPGREAQTSVDISLILAIFVKQVLAGLLLGAQGFKWLFEHFTYYYVVVGILTSILCVVSFRVLMKSSFEMKMLSFYAGLGFLASVILPTTVKALGDNKLLLLFESNTGARYWFIPMFVLLALVLAGTFQTKEKLVRYASIFLLILSLVGISFDFREKPLPDYEVKKSFQEVYAAKKGEKVYIPVSPVGPEDWGIKIFKK